MKKTQAGWAHQDGDEYVTEGVARLECSADMPGESHGICDGFGTCQCSPPFIGDDCATKDCPRRETCSFSGWCFGGVPRFPAHVPPGVHTT
ncbi:unnamed protein product [Laminaria digitata]